MYCPMRGSCLANKKSLNTSSSVNHSSSLQQVNILFPLVQSLFFPTSSLPHIFLGSCHFKVVVPCRHTIGKSQRCLSITSVTLPGHLLGLSASIFLWVSLLGCLWCQWYSWVRWSHVHPLMLPDDAQTWAEQHPMLCRNKAAIKTDGLFSKVISPLTYISYKIRGNKGLCLKEC